MPQTESASSSGSTVQFIALISAQQTFDSETAAISSYFYRLEDPTFVNFQEEFTDSLDTCYVTGHDNELVLAPLNLLQQLDKTPISAGDPVTYITDSGAVGELTRGSMFEGAVVIYEPATFPGILLAENLRINIPGDEFPAFSNVAVPSVQELNLTPSIAQPVNSETEFRWTMSDEPLADIAINASFLLPNGDELGVYCDAKDDGSFVYPAEVKQQINGASSGIVTSLHRVVRNFDTRGNAMVIVRSRYSSVSDAVR